MPRSRLLFVLVALVLAAPLPGQDLAGTYTTQGAAGFVTLKIEAAAGGKFSGSLGGNGVSYRLEAAPGASGITGKLHADGEVLPFAANRQGNLLYVKIFDVNPDGSPDLSTAETLVFQRQAAASSGTRPSAPSTATPTPQAGASAGNTERNVIVNGVRVSAQTLTKLEQAYRIRIQDAEYWYDKKCGGWGLKGGPTAGFIQAGLDLGGTLAPDASNGNTGVFTNGRELHTQDVLALQSVLGPIMPGRYLLDALGNVSYEGGAFILNLVQATRFAQQRRPGNWSSGITNAGGAWDGGGSGYVMGRDGTGKSWSVSY